MKCPSVTHHPDGCSYFYPASSRQQGARTAPSPSPSQVQAQADRPSMQGTLRRVLARGALRTQGDFPLCLLTDDQELAGTGSSSFSSSILRGPHLCAGGGRLPTGQGKRWPHTPSPPAHQGQACGRAPGSGASSSESPSTARSARGFLASPKLLPTRLRGNSLLLV